MTVDGRPPFGWWLKAYAAAWLTVIVLDAIWLGLLASRFYAHPFQNLVEKALVRS